MSTTRLRRLMLATVLVSGYNIVVFFLDFYKATEPDYFDPAFWALLPQLVLTFLMVRKWPKTNNASDWDNWSAPRVGLWIIIVFSIAFSIRSYDPSSYEGAWGFVLSVLAAVGIPTHVLINSANSAWSDSPFWGLFHTPWQREDGEVVYLFNLGIGFSWLLFNILFVILIVSVFRLENSLENNASAIEPSYSPEQKAKEDVSSESKELPGAMTALDCASCGNELKKGDKFCSNCGGFAEDKPLFTENQDVECDQCGAELIKNQKFCSSCGVEIEWPNEVGASTKAIQVPPAVSNPSWAVKHFRALGGIGRALAITWIIFNGLAILSLFGEQSSPDDLSKCNGLYDANILKTYGVFRCPAIYNSTESSFDSNALLGLAALNLIVFGCFYAYTSFKISRSK